MQSATLYLFNPHVWAEALHRHGYTIVTLGSRLEVGHTTVWAIGRGLIPAAHERREIADVLDVDVDRLWIPIQLDADGKVHG